MKNNMMFDVVKTNTGNYEAVANPTYVSNNITVFFPNNNKLNNDSKHQIVGNWMKNRGMGGFVVFNYKGNVIETYCWFSEK